MCCLSPHNTGTLTLAHSLTRAGHSENAHIKCCAKQQAQYKSNGDLKRLVCEKCDSGYEPTKNREQCISKVGSKCKTGYGPTPGYFEGKQKCVKCSDRNCKDCSSIFYDCNQYVSDYIAMFDSPGQRFRVSVLTRASSSVTRLLYQVQEGIRHGRRRLHEASDVVIEDPESICLVCSVTCKWCQGRTVFVCASLAIGSAMEDIYSPVAAEACSPAGNGACSEEERRELVVRRDSEAKARPRSPPSDPKPSTSGPMTDLQHIEDRIAGRFDSLACLLEEQNSLLRALVERWDVGPERDQRVEGVEGGKPSTDRASTSALHNIDGRPASRLQKMGKASASREEDLDIERRKALPGKTSRPNGGRQQQMSLAERKREFVMKTTPGTGTGAVHGKGAGDIAGSPVERRVREPRRSRHSRTRLAVAAAKREMERGEAQRALDKVVEREQANSIGAWIIFVLLAVLGAVALASGFIAFRRSKKEVYQPSRGEL